MSFKSIHVENPELDRVQQNVKLAFDALPAAADPTIVNTNGPQYRVLGNEAFVLVDSRRGPVTIVMPPLLHRRPPVVKNTTTSANAVTVQTLDRSLIDGAATITVAPLAAVSLVFDGRAWWSY